MIKTKEEFEKDKNLQQKSINQFRRLKRHHCKNR